ncbi:glycoside hydrolase family 6 protein [Microbacterium amylolyticum]|uniref:Glucanase n=1 Tax=Microbacterium amylolyticum TaxID=936337 RepID=A0ABS4ZJ61_9MICO|nr:glycoside hydrolase family 6 protein [Microbacterium amylolyticum]MBP2437048.1 endoglucanase [Microbacterium amylolyticum]
MRLLSRPWIRIAATTLALTLTAFGAAPAASAANPPDLTSGFYVDPNSGPAEWANANPQDGRSAAIRQSIAQQPMARWFGNWSGPIGTATGSYAGAASHSGKLPIMVAYNISGRDACGGHSGGGAGTASAYNSWIAAFAGGIAQRPAVVILEPDALGDFNCLSSAQVSERQALLRNAINQLNTQAPNTWTYLDAGNPGWISAAAMAERLHSSGVQNARGFSLNISNFISTASNTSYGNAINAQLSSRFGYTKPFVIDTSRNGVGAANTPWCNPAGQKLGATSRYGGGAEMLLWIKTPGQSDGDCGVGLGSTAGQFLPEVAYKMIFGH